MFNCYKHILCSPKSCGGYAIFYFFSSFLLSYFISLLVFTPLFSSFLLSTLLYHHLYYINKYQWFLQLYETLTLPRTSTPHIPQTLIIDQHRIMKLYLSLCRGEESCCRILSTYIAAAISCHSWLLYTGCCSPSPHWLWQSSVSPLGDRQAEPTLAAPGQLL